MMMSLTYHILRFIVAAEEGELYRKYLSQQTIFFNHLNLSINDSFL